MKTEKIIYKMLTENTGEHFLDSGGAYGRHWQRNQKKSLNDFRKEKYISYDSDGYATKSLFHHLIESIDYLPYETKMLNDWIKKDKYDWVKNPNGRGHIISDVSNFMEEYFYPDKKIHCEYTYNCDNVLSQNFQFLFCEIYETDKIALCTHNGCDARGGMSDYKMFKPDWDMLFNYTSDYYESEDIKPMYQTA